MHIKSSFPEQAKVPESDCNAYEALWNRHEQTGSDDIVLHIDGISGRKRTYQEFRTRAVLAASAMETSVSGNREMIAIISENSLVREIQVPWSWSFILVTSRTMLYSSIPCFFLRRRSLCLIHIGHPSNSSMP